MTKDTVQNKRRGRPSLPADQKKRHTMTFRMRDDLRAAVQELAQTSGRSLSEQIEYYVEASVQSEIALIWQWSFDAVSPTLMNATLGNQRGGLNVRFDADHTTSLRIAGKNQSAKPLPMQVEMFNLHELINTKRISGLSHKDVLSLVRDIISFHEKEVGEREAGLTS